MYVVGKVENPILSYDDNNHGNNNQRNMEQESDNDDDEDIEEIIQDVLRCAKIARERLKRKKFYRYGCTYIHGYSNTVL